MVYIVPVITVYSEEQVDEMIGAAACGSKPGSCYNACNGKDCEFSIG